jgi:hypothetical protein
MVKMANNFKRKAEETGNVPGTFGEPTPNQPETFWKCFGNRNPENGVVTG